MTKIVLEQGSWGAWTASTTQGWDHVEVRHIDREQALLLLLAKLDVEVVQKGEYWVQGKSTEWQISNMKEFSY